LALRWFEKLDGYGRDFGSFWTVQPMATEENLSSTASYREFDNALPNYRIALVLFDP
jgi:hypothetical protein